MRVAGLMKNCPAVVPTPCHVRFDSLTFLEPPVWNMKITTSDNPAWNTIQLHYYLNIINVWSYCHCWYDFFTRFNITCHSKMQKSENLRIVQERIKVCHAVCQVCVVLLCVTMNKLYGLVPLLTCHTTRYNISSPLSPQCLERRCLWCLEGWWRAMES